MRPIYLISKTPFEGVIHIPISFLNPVIYFAQYEGIILTSKQALLALQYYTFAWENLQCICVSEGTAEAAREAGVVQVEVGNGYGKSIPDVLNSKKRQGKWLYLRPKVIASEWVEHARSKGFEIDEAVVYETTCNKDIDRINITNDAVLIFTSPSSIECFLKHHIFHKTQTVVVIGQTTKNALPKTVEGYISPETTVASAVKTAQKIAQTSSPF